MIWYRSFCIKILKFNTLYFKMISNVGFRSSVAKKYNALSVTIKVTIQTLPHQCVENKAKEDDKIGADLISTLKDYSTDSWINLSTRFALGHFSWLTPANSTSYLDQSYPKKKIQEATWISGNKFHKQKENTTNELMFQISNWAFSQFAFKLKTLSFVKKKLCFKVM